MFDLSNFWLALLIACLVWYSTITVYVAIRGAADINHMLGILGERRPFDDEPQKPGHSHPATGDDSELE